MAHLRTGQRPGGPRRARRGAWWCAYHGNNIYGWHNRVAHLGAHQPIAIG
jgi:hypothetical protein